MKFGEALDIWIGDYVQIKDTFKELTVLDKSVFCNEYIYDIVPSNNICEGNSVIITCNDGCKYHHSRLKSFKRSRENKRLIRRMTEIYESL